VVEKVRSDQTCHTGANYSHLLLCFALCERHLDDALQIPMKNGLQKSGRSSDCCGACKALHSKIKRNSLMAELYEINRTGETKDCTPSKFVRDRIHVADPRQTRMKPTQ
jgi:hypothetical protein